MELGLEESVQVVLDQEALVRVAKAQVWNLFIFFGLINRENEIFSWKD